MIVRITGLILCLTALVVPVHLPAAEMRARSISVLDQSESRGPFFHQIFAGLRSGVNADTRSHITLYAENLDLGRFNSAAYEESLRQLTESAVIAISDAGLGIPPDGLDEVFDPFFTTKQQGMGIGLSIARTIVQAHMGRIRAENVAGGGAVFRLSLPLCLT